MPERKMAPELLNYKQWPGVDERLLSEPTAVRYSRLSGAVKAACDGVRSGEIKRRFGISRSLLHYFIGQCTSYHQDGQLRGFRALVPTDERAGYTRVAEPISGPNGSGLAGAFEQLLRECPKTAAWLDRRIKPDDGTKFQAAGLNMATIHQEFLAELRKEGRKPHQYPFTTKRHGYEALCTNIRKRIAEGDDDAARNRYGDQATSRAGTKSGKTSLLRPIVALERAGYDEYELPDIETTVIESDGEEFDLPLSRGYFCPIVDFKTAAILGYSYSIAGRFRAVDLLQAFECAIHPPARIEHPAFKELDPLPDEGLPAAVLPAAKARRVCSLIVDNHLTHLANSVVVDLRRSAGIPISFGKIRSWIERNVVEGIFAEFQRSLRKISSTTGSGPKDPAVRDPVKKAVRYRVRAADIRALLDQLVARHNARRRRALMMVTPNEAIASDWSDHARLQIVPGYSSEFVANPRIAIEVDWPTVRGSRATHRKPYIQIDEVEYTNDVLKQSWSLIGTRLKVEIRGDFRTVRAFRPDGTEFGVLHVDGWWALSPHTRETRKEINRLYREGVFKDRATDPVDLYQRHLAEGALAKNRGRRRPKITREADKLARSLEVQGSGSAPPNFKYKMPAPRLPASPTAKPRGRRAFFSPPGRTT